MAYTDDSNTPAAPTVLLVEDNRLVRMTVRHYLEKNGYRVLEAADGEQAVQRFADSAGTFSVLVTDMNLPGMSGAQVAARLARPDVRVVFISARSRTYLLAEGLIARDDVSLTKPFSELELLDALARARATTPDRGRLSL